MQFFLHAEDCVVILEHINGELQQQVFQYGVNGIVDDTDLKPDVILLLHTLHHSEDIQSLLSRLQSQIQPQTKILIAGYNHVWEPLIRFAEWIGIKKRKPLTNWLSRHDVKNLLFLESLEVYQYSAKMLLPFNIPILSFLFNNILCNMPLISHCSVNQYYFARPIPQDVPAMPEHSVTVLIPARNESGNIEQALLRMPRFGKWQEIMFVEGNSTDDTWDQILKMQEKYKDQWKITALQQTAKGKANAVQEGFRKAQGDILMILDADLTVPPEDLPKFYNAIREGKGDFINGSRLIYAMEQNAMRGFNFLGNKAFSLMFSWLLNQPIKDTLCGTKVIFKKDFEKLESNRHYFGNFDPFGDFDLIFGAYKLRLKIIDLPIHYKARTYGDTNISRWKHGTILLKMWLFALVKIKYRY